MAHSQDDSRDPLEQTTARLVSDARSDREHFGMLYRRVAPSLYAWARLRVSGPLRTVLDLEDVVQEVWCRALEALPTYDPARASFRTWVFAIANHVILKGYRQLAGGAKRRSVAESSLAEIPDEATSISRELVHDETLDRCVKELLALEDDERLLVIHCGLEGLPASEAGRLLGVSADAVAKRWQRLRARLRDVAAFKDLLAP